MQLGFGLVLAAVVVVGIVVLAKGNTGGGRSGTVKVVAAENFWGSIAQQIGGSRVSVTSIITDPSADPHLYESDARDAAALSAADVVVNNGLGYDDFMDKLLSASPNTQRQVLVAADILGVTADGANPHVWYDIPRVQVVAERIEAALAAKDPAHKSEYEQNLAHFKDSVQPLVAAMAQIKAHYPGAPVAYTERVPGYLLADAGLSVKTPAGFARAIEDGDNPSPADTAAMDTLMTSHSVKVLLYNSQATSAVSQHVRDLATQNGIPVVGVTETIPSNEKTYQSWQLDQLHALIAALGQ
jgi:zinc/manganese transport system substrate-binding protein